MQRLFAVVTGALLCGLVAVAAEKPSDAYRKAMADLGAFSSGIDKAVTDQDFETATTLAQSAKSAFEFTEGFWRGKDPEAAKLADRGRMATSDLLVMAGIKNQEGVAFAAMEAKEVCAGCHMAHRERLPDGSFEIK